MIKKKILIVSRSFFPQNSPRSFRTTELAKEFARQGHKVTVLTPKNQEIHPAFEKEHRLTIKDLGQPKWKSPDFGSKGVRYFLTRAAVRFLQLGFEYPDIELMFLVNKALKKESGYDLLISIAVPYPIHWGVAKARTKKHPIAKTWVADCGDPYMLATSDTFKKLFYFKYFEKTAFKKANFIAVPIEEAKDAYYPEFRSKIKIIPQGFEFPEIQTKTLVKNNVVTFAYSGAISPYQHYAIPFLKFLNDLDKPFVFKIFTKEKAFYKKHLTLETLKKCIICDYIPREDLLKEYFNMDFLLYFPYLQPQQKPLKLIDYQFSGKPILAFKNDEFSKGAFKEFLGKNFNKGIPKENIDKYRIENVCSQFLALAANEK